MAVTYVIRKKIYFSLISIRCPGLFLCFAASHHVMLFVLLLIGVKLICTICLYSTAFFLKKILLMNDISKFAVIARNGIEWKEITVNETV